MFGPNVSLAFFPDTIDGIFGKMGFFSRPKVRHPRNRKPRLPTYRRGTFSESASAEAAFCCCTEVQADACCQDCGKAGLGC